MSGSGIVRLSTRGQIVIPSDIRSALGLSASDELFIEVKGERIVMRPKPKNYTQALRGLHREVWQGVDEHRYVGEERASWDKGTRKPDGPSE